MPKYTVHRSEVNYFRAEIEYDGEATQINSIELDGEKVG